MSALIILCGILFVGFIIFLLKLILLKKDIRQLGKKLNEIINTDTNANLRADTLDKDIVALTENINQMLVKTRLNCLEVLQTEYDLKRAITNISHDLRTPLTSAKGYLQMAEIATNVEDTSRYLQIIKERMESLTVLIDSLFAFSNAVEGNINLSRINIGNILRDALSDCFALINENDFTVEVEIPDTPIYCLCNEDALKRVLQNLIVNSCIHGNELIRVRMNENVIEIANKAANLNEIDTERIFERFYTADASRANKGLGLAIAKELTKKMGSSISAKKNKDMLVVCINLPLTN